MGRRRTLINDFGANWTTERVSAKKKNAQMANEHDSNSNHHSIPSILCYQFNHEYSHNSNSHIRTIVSYFIYSVSRFFSYSICFSCFFFLCFLSNFFSLFSHFFFLFFQCVSSVIFSDSRQTRQQKKKKKEKNVMCGVSDVIAVKSNFASPSTKKKYGLAGLHFCLRFRKFTRRNVLEISMIVRDRSDNASANYVTSCCF